MTPAARRQALPLVAILQHKVDGLLVWRFLSWVSAVYIREIIMTSIYWQSRNQNVAQVRAKLYRDFLKEFTRTPVEHWSLIKKDRSLSWEHSRAIKKAARAVD